MSEIDPAALAFEWLLERRSVSPKDLRPPAPGFDVLQRAAALAERAPDHRTLRPFRFVNVPDAARERLAALFEVAAVRRGASDEDRTKARERAFNGPALLALVVRIDESHPEVPAHEQWLAAGAALMNFLNALHLEGFGAKVLGGSLLADDGVQSAFCDAGERIAAWIVAGTPRVRPARKAPAEAPARSLLEDWR